MYRRNLKEDLFCYFIQLDQKKDKIFRYFTIEKKFNSLKLHEDSIEGGLYVEKEKLNLKDVYNIIGINLGLHIPILKKKSIIFLIYIRFLRNFKKFVQKRIKNKLILIKEEKIRKVVEKKLLTPLIDKDFTDDEIFYKG